MQDIPLPDPFVIHFHFDSGSTPPPNHYEYTIRIGPGSENKIIYLPDYPGDTTPQWEYTFTVDKPMLRSLYQMMLEKQLMLCRWQKEADQPTGGEQEWAEITCNRILVKIPSSLLETDYQKITPVYQAIKNLVPSAIWTELDARQKQYMEENEQPQ